MAKKTASKVVANVVANIDLVAFDGTQVTLQGVWLDSLTTKGQRLLIGSMQATRENLIALRTINSGSMPTIECNENGKERAPKIPVDPNSGKPLWKYIKPDTKNGTVGYMVPIQSAMNRPTDGVQVRDLRGSIAAKGYDTKLPPIVIAVSGSGAQVVDGGHRSTAITTDIDSVSEVDNVICINVIHTDEEFSSANEIVGFDELQRTRQVRDILAAMNVSPKWEKEVQEVLSNLILLCSGKALNGSGKSLPHIIDDLTNKPKKLTPSDVAALLGTDIPGFSEILEITKLLDDTKIMVLDDKTEQMVEVSVWESSTFNRYSLSAWITAIIEVSYALNIESQSVISFLADVVTNDTNVITAKLNAWAADKGKGKQGDQYPVLCTVLLSKEALGEAPLPRNKPKARNTSMLKVAYDAWMDSIESE